MIDFYGLVKDTQAYKTIMREKQKNALSHAYLLVVPDKIFIKEYLAEFAKLIMGANGNTRLERLIETGTHADVKIYPKNRKNILTNDVKEIIEESYFKPTESEIKLFIIENAETMNTSSQNKLLKTLEEPPKNVVILLGALSEFTLLPTVKSRVKKLELLGLNEEQVVTALKDEYNESDVRLAYSLSDGTLGSVKEILCKEEIRTSVALSKEILLNMQSSSSVLDYSVKISALKTDFNWFLSVLAWTFSGALKEGEITSEYPNGYKAGSIINALYKINEAKKRLTFNSGAQMVAEWLLLQILEGRFKWQKL